MANIPDDVLRCQGIDCERRKKCGRYLGLSLTSYYTAPKKLCKWDNSKVFNDFFYMLVENEEKFGNGHQQAGK